MTVRGNQPGWQASTLFLWRAGLAAYFITHALTTGRLMFLDFLVAGLLLAGFYTRIIAGLRGALLLWETVASAPFLTILGQEADYGYRMPVAAGLAALLLLLTGAGRFSVDWFFFRPGEWLR